MTDMTDEERPKPRFGDAVENGYASEDNPIRHGIFVREFKRIGRMNPGLTWELTDGNGKFWTVQPRHNDRLTVTPAIRATKAKMGAGS